MRRVSVLITIIFICGSCKNETKMDYVILSGKIENPKERIIIVEGHKLKDTIYLDTNNTFIDTLKLQANGYYSFAYGTESSSMFLKVGDSLNMSFDNQNFSESLVFEGIGAKENNFLVAKKLFKNQYPYNLTSLVLNEEKDFFDKLNKIKSLIDDFLNNTKDISDDFKELETKSNLYEYLLIIKQYPIYHKLFTRKESLNLSEEFNNITNGLVYNDEEDFINFESYRTMVKNHYGNKVSRSKNLSSVFSEIQELSPVIKDVLAKEELVNYIKSNRTQKRNEALYNGIKMLSNDISFLSLLKDKYEKVKSISKGMPSPLFIDYKNYKGGVTSLKDLQGKYVYIDFWATWCGPCIKQFPYLKDIENKFKGKNITFVSISIDKTEQYNTWFKMIKDKNLKGIQLLADNDWQSKFIKDYNIENIPRFILIDPNGYIISPDAPSPSDPKLIALLDKLEI